MTWRVCGDEEDIDDVDIDDVDIDDVDIDDVDIDVVDNDDVDNDDVDIDVEIDRRGICHKRHKQRWCKQNLHLHVFSGNIEQFANLVRVKYLTNSTSGHWH